MTSTTTPSFRKAFDALPSEVQERAREAFARFREDPQHPGLRLKRVYDSKPIYSVRVTLAYRALAVRHEQDEWIWFWIGSLAGHEAPAPLSLPHHSGQFRLRIPRSAHSWLAARAESEGVSLNTLIVQILSEARGAHAEQPLARGART